MSWIPVHFFLVHGFCVQMLYNSSVAGEYHKWHCSVLEYMSLLGRSSILVDDLIGDLK